MQGELPSPLSEREAMYLAPYNEAKKINRVEWEKYMSKIKDYSLKYPLDKFGVGTKQPTQNPYEIKEHNKYAREETFGKRGQIDDPNFTTNPLG